MFTVTPGKLYRATSPLPAQSYGRLTRLHAASCCSHVRNPFCCTYQVLLEGDVFLVLESINVTNDENDDDIIFRQIFKILLRDTVYLIKVGPYTEQVVTFEDIG